MEIQEIIKVKGDTKYNFTPKSTFQPIYFHYHVENDAFPLSIM